MSNARTILRGVVVAALCAGLIFLGAVMAASLGRIARYWTDPDELTGMAETATDLLADSLMEAGLRPQGLDPDDPLLQQRQIVVSEGINEGVARRVVESLLYLDAQDEKEPIDLYLSTAGGWLDAAFAIVDTIVAIEAPVNTIALGGCYSAGTVVLVAGTGKRSASPNAVLSVHANLGHSTDPYAYDHHEEARVEAHFRRYAKLPESWYPLSGDSEHYYFNADDAKAMGVIDPD